MPPKKRKFERQIFVVFNTKTHKIIKGTETPNRATAQTRAGKLNKKAGTVGRIPRRYDIKKTKTERGHA